ncbi:AcrR family transcriptional regulator [Sphingopyxis sp. OAS728]|uniref:TetR/AcrR family transcriptional regulator n=1 Tax=Sphingopyxis sp. OAS728 TaxID=2663823 RepID=UPI00178B1F6B|nr:TetR/AcrR family transcriptional regulator [Sphingopyxis sp. OAS728]MBE1527991.1 AcrR family transcriptional regulator [Sphingopyxis sp. OAS728]
MSKADTIDALLESATLSFARDSFSGASLREVAARANLALGTIHFYFGSKTELYAAATRKIWLEISNERDALLARALEDGATGETLLRELVRALGEPIIRRALGTDERELAQLKVVRGRVPDEQGGELDRSAGRSVARWIDALAQACPGLSRKDLVWTYSFILGVIWGWQSIDHRYDDMMHDDLTRTPEDAMTDIVEFATAGVSALVALRAHPPED